MVTGAGGLLGSWTVPALELGGHSVTALNGRNEPGGIDLADRGATMAYLRAIRPDIIVNLAAATDVDACELDPQSAYLANVRLVENLAEAVTHEFAAHLVHLSTDQVYDGRGPHGEADVTLQNYYAFSKYAGEIAARSVNATILRTNFFGPSRVANRRSFSDWIVDSCRQGRPIRVFTDIIFSPLAMDTVAQSIELIVRNPHPGVFNLGSSSGMSKADFALRLATCMGLPLEHMTPAPHDSSRWQARRSTDMRMNSAHFTSTFGAVLPSLEDEITRMKHEYAAYT